MVYSTRRFVLCLSLCHFVLVFFSPFSIAITSLVEERADLCAYRTFFRFVFVWICRFPLPLGVCEGVRFVIVALPGLFSYLFCCWPMFQKHSGWQADISRVTDWYTGEQFSWQVFVYFVADGPIHSKCIPQVTGWYIGVQCSWQVFVADWYSGVHVKWQAAIAWVTDWYAG